MKFVNLSFLLGSVVSLEQEELNKINEEVFLHSKKFWAD
jgi:hypothetical protein